MRFIPFFVLLFSVIAYGSDGEIGQKTKIQNLIMALDKVDDAITEACIDAEVRKQLQNDTVVLEQAMAGLDPNGLETAINDYIATKASEGRSSLIALAGMLDLWPLKEFTFNSSLREHFLNLHQVKSLFLDLEVNRAELIAYFFQSLTYSQRMLGRIDVPLIYVYEQTEYGDLTAGVFDWFLWKMRDELVRLLDDASGTPASVRVKEEIRDKIRDVIIGPPLPVRAPFPQNSLMKEDHFLTYKPILVGLVGFALISHLGPEGPDLFSVIIDQVIEAAEAYSAKGKFLPEYEFRELLNRVNESRSNLSPKVYSEIIEGVILSEKADEAVFNLLSFETMGLWQLPSYAHWLSALAQTGKSRFGHIKSAIQARSDLLVWPEVDWRSEPSKGIITLQNKAAKAMYAREAAKDLAQAPPGFNPEGLKSVPSGTQRVIGLLTSDQLASMRLGSRIRDFWGSPLYVGRDYIDDDTRSCEDYLGPSNRPEQRIQYLAFGLLVK